MSLKMAAKYSITDLTKIKIDYLDFNFKILPKNVFDFVYKPGDDSYLLLHTILTDINTIKNKSSRIILEIG